MNEIDLYSAYQLPSTVGHYNNKIKKPKKGKHKWFILLIIIIFVAIVFFVANAFANFLSFSSTSVFGNNKVAVKGFNIYAVSLNTFEDKESATTLASEVKLEGGAGYVLNDVNYSVLASIYASSSDAQNVLEKVLPTYPNAGIEVIKINRCELQALSSDDENEQVQNALNIFKTAYQSLYDIGISLDTSQITSAQAKVKISDLLNSASAIASAFGDIATATSNAKYKLTQAKVDQVVDLLNDLTESVLISTRLSSLIKYNQISCLMLQNELALLVG